MMYSVVRSPLGLFLRESGYIIVSFFKNKEGIHFINHTIPQFPNPFDAYFYLLENYKEEEIV